MLAAALALVWSRPAAASVALGLGADYLVDPSQGAFQLTLAADTPLARHLSVGARFGAMLVSGPSRLGVPIDARLRIHMERVYLEGLVGPWIVTKEDPAVRFHGAVGFGVVSRGLQLGLEVGYLDPSAMIGVRLAFPF
jgi:hypothetical protein